MPVGKVDVTSPIFAESYPCNFQFEAQKTREEKDIGFVGDIKVKPVVNYKPASFVDRLQSYRLDAQGKAFDFTFSHNTVNELRDIGSGILGSAEGGSFVKSPADSSARATAKIISAVAPLTFAGNICARISTGRGFSWASAINKSHLAYVPKETLSALSMATKPFAAVFGAQTAILALKRSYDIAYDTAVDISRDPVRQEMQALLKDYDPIRRAFVNKVTGETYRDDNKVKRLIELAKIPNTWNGNSQSGSIWRTRGQRAMDSLANVRDVVPTFGVAASSLMLTAATPGSSLAFGGGVCTAVSHGMISVNNFMKFGVQGFALNNIEHARRLSQAKIQYFGMKADTAKIDNGTAVNSLLMACANRMIQERTYAARSAFLNGVNMGISSIAVAIGTAGIHPIATLATSVFSSVLYVITTIGSYGFDRWHNTTVAKRRKEGKAQIDAAFLARLRDITPEQRIEIFKSLDTKEAIGALEVLLLHTLREGTPAEVREAYLFLQCCGISKNTIKSFMVEPSPDKALSLLQTQMYTARTHVRADGLRYTPYTAGYISGVTYAKRAIQGQESDLSREEVARLLEEDVEFNTEDVVEETNPYGSFEHIEPINGDFVERDTEETDTAPQLPPPSMARVKSYERRLYSQFYDTDNPDSGTFKIDKLNSLEKKET